MQNAVDPKTILIVEDNLVNQKLLLVLLRHKGYQLLTAVDGEEALKVAAREIPDLILMDLQIPKLNGYEVTRQLKTCPATAQIPVVALTAHAMSADAARAETVSFADFITKPIDTRAFPHQIQEILQRHPKRPA